ncbi:hypothetical protein BC832DRAFT_173709 [Gaertneriomyces semiglobifer]|nr:hypothetical protein BC832DRAFT_173709 [Gaertneriomyces semiglobifer]
MSTNASTSSPTGPSAPRPVAPLAQRAQKLVLSAQFVWFVGHLVTVISALLYIFTGRSSARAQWYYAKAYLGTLISYGIIMYKGHGMPQFNAAFLQRLLRDENTQYLMLALFWYFSKPLTVSLIPYTVFSFFHSLNYVRSEIVPIFLPAGTSSLGPKVQDAILRFSRANQTRALRFVANAEVWVIMPTATLGIFLGWSSFMAPFIYSRFLSFRYLMNPSTKQACAGMRVRMDALAGHPAVPPAVKKVYETVRDFIISKCDLETQQRQAEARQQ